MATGPMTPGEDAPNTDAGPQWTNHSIPYSRPFEDSLMHTVLAPPPPAGIVLLKDSEDTPSDTPSVVRSAVDTSTLPTFEPPSLPLPLDHPSRIYRSAVPGVRYTHPGGALEGGAGPGPAERAEFVQQLVEEHRVRKASHFWQAVERERQDALRELEERMRAREKAIRQNNDIEAQLVKKEEQRDLEVRVWERKMGASKG